MSDEVKWENKINENKITIIFDTNMIRLNDNNILFRITMINRYEIT